MNQSFCPPVQNINNLTFHAVIKTTKKIFLLYAYNIIIKNKMQQRIISQKFYT